MTIKPVSITMPLVEGINTSEGIIVYTARVSSPANQTNELTAPQLLRYMIREKHWSPFDMVDMTVEIVTSRAMSHQVLRHWSARFQEYSQRYADVVGFQAIELRMESESNRQSSTVVFDPVLENGELASVAVANFVQGSGDLYRMLRRAKVAGECARFILVEAANTRVEMKASVRTWIHYFMARIEKRAQKEHVLIALEIANIFKNHFPVVSEAIELDEIIRQYHEIIRMDTGTGIKEDDGSDIPLHEVIK